MQIDSDGSSGEGRFRGSHIYDYNINGFDLTSSFVILGHHCTRIRFLFTQAYQRAGRRSRGMGLSRPGAGYGFSQGAGCDSKREARPTSWYVSLLSNSGIVPVIFVVPLIGVAIAVKDCILTKGLVMVADE